MPIRFRCVYCDKLLGIARRKAGAVVNCPQCGQPLIVPTPDPEPQPAAATAGASAPAPVGSPSKLFERDDFDVVLQGDATVRAPEPPPPPKRNKSSSPPPVPTPLPPKQFAAEKNLPAPPEYPPAPMPYQPRARAGSSGIVLTAGKLIALIVVVLFLVIGAFGGGVLVGRMLN
jgi:hypothetical protein